MSRNNFLVAASRNYFFVLLYFSFFKVQSVYSTSSPCTASSCGEIKSIRYPFRLRTDRISCGFDEPEYVLDCQNNLTILNVESKQYLVKDINYHHKSIRLADPRIDRNNLSSCPAHWFERDNWLDHYGPFFSRNFQVVFIHCLTPPTNSKYIRAAFCGIRSSIFSNSFEIFSYVLFVGEDGLSVSDLEDMCAVDKVVLVSAKGPLKGDDISSLESIYDGLAYGSVYYWGIRGSFHCYFDEYVIACGIYQTVGYRFRLYHNGGNLEQWLSYYSGPVLTCLYLFVVALLALRFFIGFPILITLIVRKWRKRHLSLDENIEEFFQSQNNLTPINYAYSEIKKMTNNFNQKLGEGGYGTVYKGKLRSGPYVAVKVMDLQSTANEQEFISEVASIGRIHHFNIVQLIGFCVRDSKCALVYEYLPNGSLDRYIFGEKLLNGLALNIEKLYEIALGVARGIEYLHQGCDMQILHFDIKPHNILLDENFNPKISDFGLAKVSDPTNVSSLSDIVTDARGTMGYMAPEMFFKNIGRVSVKADIYSYGMLLLEMAGRRRNLNPFDDDVDRAYYPSWVYDQVSAGRDIEIVDASEDEKKMVKKIIIVALWCIQMKPCDRPPMNKVMEMLEVTDCELRIPPKPFLAPREFVSGDNNQN